MSLSKCVVNVVVVMLSLGMLWACNTSQFVGDATSVVEPTTTTPVSEHIIYTQSIEESQTSGLYRMSFDGSDKQLVFTCPDICQIDSLSVSPDRQQIAYVTQTNGLSGMLHLVNAEGTNDRILTNADFIGHQAFSPDGTQLVFGRYRTTDSAPVPETSLWLYDIVTEIEQQITLWEFFVGPATWVDQQHLVFSQAENGTPPSGWSTYHVSVSGETEPQQITEGQLIQISPDNKTLLLQVEADNQQYNLQLVTIDEGPPQIIAENSGTISAASWSSRNDTIALFNQQEQALQLYDINTNTLDTIVSVSDGTVWNIIWDSAGENVIFTTGITGAEELNRFDVTTSTEYLLTDLPGSLTQLIATIQ